MNWEKHGRIFVANGQEDWMQSHAYCPTPCRIDDVIRVYAAFLDEDNVGRVGYVDLDPEEPTTIHNVSNAPVLDIGSSGAFDEHGVTPTGVYQQSGNLYLYYFGWQRGESVRYRLFTGIAVRSSGSFERCSESPILPPIEGESIVRSAPTVLEEDGKIRMWYVAGNEWIEIKGKEVPTYNLRHTTFTDFTNKNQSQGETVLKLKEDEIGFGRPYVVRDSDCYRLWYSIRRANTYRIGYAESKDGIAWTRKDNLVGIDVSDSGWDSEMICFPAVFDIEGNRHMLYNGNDFGKSGFGLAELQ